MLDTDPSETNSAPQRTKVDIEVILKDRRKHEFIVQEFEGARIRRVPTHGVKMVKKNPPYVTLRMSESRAIDAGLA